MTAKPSIGAAQPPEAAVELIEEHSRLKDESPRILPAKRLAFTLRAVLLTLGQVRYGTPIP